MCDIELLMFILLCIPRLPTEEEVKPVASSTPEPIGELNSYSPKNQLLCTSISRKTYD